MIPEKAIEFANEGLSWLGTPFDYGACQKGRGIDCAKFIFFSAKNVGMIEGDMPPHVPKFWPESKAEDIDPELFRKQILKYAFEIPIGERRVGDVVSFLWKGFECHLGIMVDDDCVVHAQMRNKVVKTRFKTMRYPKACYRWKGFE